MGNHNENQKPRTDGNFNEEIQDILFTGSRGCRGGDARGLAVSHSIGSRNGEFAGVVPSKEPAPIFYESSEHNQALGKAVDAIKEYMVGIFESDHVRLAQELIAVIEKLKSPVFIMVDENESIIKKEEWHSTATREEVQEIVGKLAREGRVHPVDIETEDNDNADRGTPPGLERE